LAGEHNVKTISFPSVSTGAYGYPIRDAARIALGETRRYLERPSTTIQEVLFVLFSQADYEIYYTCLRAMSTREG
jgi:O-acetyl-ADP-ribose deacetylase (regulator of RNase III)